MNTPPGPPPRWMSVVLVLAGAYNLAWAAWSASSPADSLRLAWGVATDDATAVRLWQGVGALVGVFGIGYALAARDPVRHWLVVFVGLLSKILAVCGALQGAASGLVTDRALLLAVPNDLIWCVPFGLILRHAYRTERGVSRSTPPDS